MVRKEAQQHSQSVVRRRPADAWRPSIGERDSRSEGDSAPVAPAADHTEVMAQSVRASACRAEGCGFEPRWPRGEHPCRSDVAQRQRPWSQKPLSVGSNPTVAMHFALSNRRSSADQSTWLRTRGSRVRLTPAVLVHRGWCKRLGTRGCDPLRAGSSPVPLMQLHTMFCRACSSVAEHHQTPLPPFVRAPGRWSRVIAS